MTIAFTQAKTTTVNYPGSPYEIEITFDSSPTEDSLLVAMSWGGTTSSGAPSGWSTAVAGETGPGYLNRYIYYKTAGASESSTVTRGSLA